MKQLITDKIIRTAAAPLTEEDKYVLNYRKSNYLFALVCVYVLMAGFCIYFGTGKSNSTNLDNKSFRIHFSSSDTEGLRATVPYICGLIFIISAFLAIKFVRKSITPLINDVKSGNKTLLYFIPVKTFETSPPGYYFSIPLVKSQQAEVSREVFENTGNNEELCLEMTTNSNIIFRLSKGGKEIIFK